MAIWDEQAMGTSQASARNKGKEHYFVEKEEEVGRVAWKESLLEQGRSSGGWRILTGQAVGMVDFL